MGGSYNKYYMMVVDFFIVNYRRGARQHFLWSFQLTPPAHLLPYIAHSAVSRHFANSLSSHFRYSKWACISLLLQWINKETIIFNRRPNLWKSTQYLLRYWTQKSEAQWKIVFDANLFRNLAMWRQLFKLNLESRENSTEVIFSLF